jgi:hypothetical protein
MLRIPWLPRLHAQACNHFFASEAGWRCLSLARNSSPMNKFIGSSIRNVGAGK